MNFGHFLVLIPLAFADWLALTSAKELPRMKGDTEDNCMPDIHSWTAATWGDLKNNYSQAAETKTNIPSGAPRSSEGKMLLLQAAHNQLMQQIESRITVFGLDREARGGKGGMGSMEGALITISLLTFAVYLIKLVMMLINALHHKKSNNTMDLLSSTALPATQANLQTFVVSHGRRRRSFITDQQQWKFLAELINLHFK